MGDSNKIGTGRLTWYIISSDYVECYNDDKEYLGRLRYQRTGTFMHWCWEDQPLDVRMSPGCVQEVREMQRFMHNKQKNGGDVMGWNDVTELEKRADVEKMLLLISAFTVKNTQGAELLEEWKQKYLD